MKFKILALIVIGALACILSFCSKAPHLKPGYKPPEEIVNLYLEAMRWQDYDEARTYVAPEVQAEFDQFVKKNSPNLKFEDCQIKQVTLSQDGYQAKVRIARSFIVLPSVTLQQEEIVQNWKLINGKWYLSGPPF